MTTTAAGAQAEALAARYLSQQGYRIVERNFRVKGGELDLVALDGPVTCFVEVRSRSHAAYGRPEETIGPRKRARLTLAARHWLARNRAGKCRFDAVAILGDQITLIKDAFRL